eukprot:8727004-Ditylum_brightwellii.AAC.1
METFKNTIVVVKHTGRMVGEQPKLNKYILKLNGKENTTNGTTIANYLKKLTDAYLAYALIPDASHQQYAEFLED